MPTVASAARATVKDGAVWRSCVSCGLLAALAPEVFHCESCRALPLRESAVDVLVSLAAKHTGGLCMAATNFDQMADAYAGLARARTGAPACELNALAADLREAANRLRTGGAA